MSLDRFPLPRSNELRNLPEPYEGATVCKECKEIFIEEEVKAGNYDGEYQGTDVDDEGGAYECWKFWHNECPETEAKRRVA